MKTSITCGTLSEEFCGNKKKVEKVKIETRKTNKTISMHQIKNNCETNGFAVVVVAEMCDYKEIIDYLKKWSLHEVKFMTPGFVIRDAEACVYDSILSVKVAKESFMDAQKMRNFIRGGNTRILFEDYIEMV